MLPTLMGRRLRSASPTNWAVWEWWQFGQWREPAIWLSDGRVIPREA
jgi:hypothetical protein